MSERGHRPKQSRILRIICRITQKILNSVVMFSFAAFDWKHPFPVNLSHKTKTCFYAGIWYLNKLILCPTLVVAFFLQLLLIKHKKTVSLLYETRVDKFPLK